MQENLLNQDKNENKSSSGSGLDTDEEFQDDPTDEGQESKNGQSMLEEPSEEPEPAMSLWRARMTDWQIKWALILQGVFWEGCLDAINMAFTIYLIRNPEDHVSFNGEW